MVRTAQLLVCITALLGAGCDSIAAAIAPSNPTGPLYGAAPAPVAIDPDRALGQKLGEYVEHCLNAFSRSAFDSRARYLDWADPVDGPTGREPEILGLFAIHGNPRACSEAAQRASSMEPADADLDRAGFAYAEAITRLVTRVTDAYAYYEREDYRDDGMTRGRDMHEPLIDAFTAFERAHDALSRRVRERQDAIDARMLDRLGADPARKTELLVERVRIQAKSITDAAAAATVSGERTLEGIAADDFAAKVAGIEQAYAELAIYASADPEGAPLLLDSYVAEGERFVVAAKEVMRRVRDRRRFDRSDMRQLGTSSGWMVDGSPDKLIDAYNDLIGRYNSL